MIDENDELLNDFDYHFNNFCRFTASPEKNLMISVLLYGVIDYLYSDNEDSKDAKYWIYEAHDDEWPYSFENICFVLGIQIDPFRTDLIKIKNSPGATAKAKKLKHLYPAPGNRNKISPNSIYQPKNKYE